MKNFFFITVFFILFSPVDKILANSYPVKEIPVELLNNANSVVRIHNSHFSIINKSKASLTVELAITILNEKDKNRGIHGIPYDQLRKVKYFNAEAFDASGKSIKKLKKKDFIDRSNISGFSLYEDDRVIIADLRQARYPYTVVFEYKVDFKFLFYIPSMRVLPGYNMAVESATYQLEYHPDFEPRHYVKNWDIEPETIELENGFKSLKWHFTNIKAQSKDHMASEYPENSPMIMAAPSIFEYDGYEGNMDSWEGFGKWIYSLNRDRNDLPEETAEMARNMTSGVSSNREKVEILYNYLQNKTRYVSIQLGIGGFQPFHAHTVDQKGYGDCKALSNYMGALLEAVGIPSYYTLVKAGRGVEDVIPEFPSNQFNHAILAVPDQGDTLWLECTSQTNPFGYMGSFTSDRWVLLITEDGGKLARTPVYDQEKNLQVRKAEIMIHPNGDAEGKVSTFYQGLQYENSGLFSVLHKGREDQKKWLQNFTDIPSFEIKEFDLLNYPDVIPLATIELELSLRRFANASGKRIFLHPNLMNRFDAKLPKEDSRSSGFRFLMPYIDIDSIEYTFTERFYPEFVPEDITIESEFGTYNSRFIFDSGKLLYIRKIYKKSGEFPPEKFNDYVDFTREVNKADNIRIILVNTT